MKKRIWELDMLRGIFLLNIMAYHFAFDLVYLFGLVRLENPVMRVLFQMGNDWGGTPFLLISGLCITFSSRPVQRGLQVIAGGLLISLVMMGIYLLGFSDRSIMIHFGVLHCIGTCMLLWPLLKKLPVPALLAIGAVLTAVGLYLKFTDMRVSHHWFTLFGAPKRGFASSDYFPLLPNLGYFLMGAGLGKVLYPTRQTLFPRANDRIFPVSFFGFFGRHSLILYLVHQPVFAALIFLYTLIF